MNRPRPGHAGAFGQRFVSAEPRVPSGGGWQREPKDNKHRGFWSQIMGTGRWPHSFGRMRAGFPSKRCLSTAKMASTAGIGDGLSLRGRLSGCALRVMVRGHGDRPAGLSPYGPSTNARP
jgi:hypothetical protein